MHSRNTFASVRCDLFYKLLLTELLLTEYFSLSHAVLMFISNIDTAVSRECLRAFLLKKWNEYCDSVRPCGNCRLGVLQRKSKSCVAQVHISQCPLLTWCGYRHHFCWSGWHLVCVISGVCQSCRLLSTHWLTKATDSSRPIGFIQTDRQRNCIHQQGVGREVMNCTTPQLNAMAICHSYQTIVACLGSPTRLAYVQRLFCRNCCVCVCVCFRDTEPWWKNKCETSGLRYSWCWWIDQSVSPSNFSKLN